MKLPQKYLSPIDGGATWSSGSTLDYSTVLLSPELDDTAKNKIREVWDLLLQSINKEDETILQSIKLLLMQVQERITHPIFKSERSLLASAIFAHGFGRVLCAENLRYIARIINETPRMPGYDLLPSAHIDLISN
jgi:hypothetical protein